MNLFSSRNSFTQILKDAFCAYELHFQLLVGKAFIFSATYQHIAGKQSYEYQSQQKINKLAHKLQIQHHISFKLIHRLREILLEPWIYPDWCSQAPELLVCVKVFSTEKSTWFTFRQESRKVDLLKLHEKMLLQKFSSLDTGVWNCISFPKNSIFRVSFLTQMQ